MTDQASGSTDAAADVEGIDVEAVTRWLAAHVALEPPVRFERLPGGHSNLTYLLTDAAGSVAVLRRPPLGELLPSAHDMSREYRAIAALGPTPVPVPEALGFCEDPAVTGAWFYVMAYVPGRVLHDEDDAVSFLGLDERRRAGESLMEVAADLHAVDVDAVGVGDLGKRDDYVARQIRRWYGQYQASAGATPLVDRLAEHFRTHLPDQQRASLVHGDYRLGNCITRSDGTIAAVLDWEICTLGDPLADVGYALATWNEPGETFKTTATSPSTAPGFLTRDEMLAHYAANTALDCSRMPLYVAFGFWKLACINQGVWFRYDQGQKDPGDVDVAAIRASVDQLAQMADDALASSP